MELSKNRKRFSVFFPPFPKSASNFKYFGQKEEPQRLLDSETVDYKKRGYLNA